MEKQEISYKLLDMEELHEELHTLLEILRGYIDFKMENSNTAFGTNILLDIIIPKYEKIYNLYEELHNQIIIYMK